MMPSDAPILRALDLIPVSTDSGLMVCLRDPQRYSSAQALVPRDVVPLLMLMDGRNTIRDIQASYLRATGEILQSDDLCGLAQRLDELLLLDSPRFRAVKEQMDSAFLASAVRTAALAGLSYPADPEELRAVLDAHFLHPDGPGSMPGEERERPLRAAIAPHIDYQRGGPAYAHTYKAIAEGSRGIETIVILATAHQLSQGYFALTSKDFETPLGRVETDRELVAELAEALRGAACDPFVDEGLHRSEHSAEFQVVWLQHVLKGRREFRIVPVLVGSFHELLASGRRPGGDAAITAFVGALQEAIRRHEGRVLVLGGVDLAHIGPQFGDPSVLGDDDLARARQRDHEMLEHVLRGEVDAFWDSIADDMDARRVCGFPSMTVMLLAMGLRDGQLLRYEQHPDPNGSVSFASVVFPAA